MLKTLSPEQNPVKTNSELAGGLKRVDRSGTHQEDQFLVYVLTIGFDKTGRLS
jgi:hypothetical protein